MDPLRGPTPRHQQKLHRQWVYHVLARLCRPSGGLVCRAAARAPRCAAGAGAIGARAAATRLDPASRHVGLGSFALVLS
jgi:hypothetical protein